MTTGSLSRFIFAISLALAAIFTWSYLFLIFLLLFAITAAFAWGTRLKSVLSVFRYTVILMTFVFVLHLFSHPGNVLFQILGLTATSAGARIGAFYGLKVLIFAINGAILFFAVDPQDLIAPLERIARHSGPLGQPLESLALSLFLALRFLPEMTALGRETSLAFKTKGIDFRGNIIHKARVSSLILAPLFVTAFKRTELTAAALDVKGYATRRSRAVFSRVSISFGGVVVALVSVVIIIAGWRTR